MTSSRLPAKTIRVGRLTTRLTTLLAALVLAACASKGPTPAPTRSAAATRDSARPTEKPAPNKAAKGDAARKAPKVASKSARNAKAPPASAKRAPPAAVAQADRTFMRPARGGLIASFDGRGNKGMDFAGALGDPVYAARDGKVAYAASDLRGYGRMIIVKHDATYLTAYAHNSELLVKSGQSVKRGQVIARMGSSDTHRVKLHFELRRNGTAVDPAPYLMTGGAPALGSDPG